jgi:hypothetical protein
MPNPEMLLELGTVEMPIAGIDNVDHRRFPLP